MKVTKVNNFRIAVSRQEQGGRGHGILYPSPNKKGTVEKTIEQQVEERVKSANNLYGVFFRSDVPQNLQSLFEGLVGQMREGKGKDGLSILSEFKQAPDKHGKAIFANRFKYAPAGKSLKRTMELYARERLSDEWQSELRREAAVAVLCCLCAGENYENKVRGLAPEVVNDFASACSKTRGRVFVSGTDDLEKAFTELMRSTALKCQKSLYTDIKQARFSEEVRGDICRQIDSMKSEINYTVKKGPSRETKKLADLSYPNATYDRLEAVTERMRRTLKRGDLLQTAIELLQGLAQVETETGGRKKKLTWKTVIEDMMADEERRERLIRFLFAVNADYHKFNIIKSIRKINVKVQPKQKEDEEILLALSSGGNDKKAALADTLRLYASSREASDELLIRLKRILFSYFLGGERCQTESVYFSGEGIWKFPHFANEYLDSYFELDIDENKPEARMLLAELMEGADIRRNLKEIKARVRYVNYGIYRKMTAAYTEDIDRYWITYIKEYVEQNYVQGNGGCREEELYSTNMMKKCWDAIIRFLCGKYIDLGKAVYHYAMPENLSPDEKDEDGTAQRYGKVQERFRQGISSFDYEEIKAEENLQRDIAGAVAAAASNFSRSVLDYSKDLEDNEDVLMIKENELPGRVRKDANKQLLRYFGGESSCPVRPAWGDYSMVLEFKEMLAALRNENFHYTSGKKKEFSRKWAETLFAGDIEAYAEIVRDKYYTNNAAMFYSTAKIAGLVEAFYGKLTVGEAQVPAFRTVFKRNQLADYITAMGNSGKKAHEKYGVIFENALYFLLKEVYYHGFITDAKAAKYFYTAVEDYFGSQGGCVSKDGNGNVRYELKAGIDRRGYKKDYPYFDASRSFLTYVDMLHGNNLSFGVLCQTIRAEYNRQNSGQSKPEETIFKHYKLLFERCMKDAFVSFVKERYGFLNEPSEGDESSREYLAETRIGCLDDLNRGEDEKQGENCMWFVLAHLISPRQLNNLAGDFKSYIQYRNDILKRASYAGELDSDERKKRKNEISEKLKRQKEILKVLELVRMVSGRISNEFSDYYEDKESYAKYLNDYIDFELVQGATIFQSLWLFCKNTLPGGRMIDLYADEKNPKVLRNVELARMYSGGDIRLPGHKKVTAEEIRRYYGQQGEVEKILAGGLCKDMKEQSAVSGQKELRERITLHDVTGIWRIVDTLHAGLISLSYLRERDQMYLMLGFYYMAIQNAGGWQEAALDRLETKRYQIKEGLALYQVASVYTYGLPFLKIEEDGKVDRVGGSIPNKMAEFGKIYGGSAACALRLIENNAQNDGEGVYQLRNYVDHFHYFTDHKRSILDLYNGYYQLCFPYSRRLQNSVWSNFKSTLEREFVLAELRPESQGDKYLFVPDEEQWKSDYFTFKLAGGKKPVEVAARSDEFLQELKAVLLYKKGR